MLAPPPDGPAHTHNTAPCRHCPSPVGCRRCFGSGEGIDIVRSGWRHEVFHALVHNMRITDRLSSKVLVSRALRSNCDTADPLDLTPACCSGHGFNEMVS